jgi:HSP20 family molecular chaperone IbpA
MEAITFEDYVGAMFGRAMEQFETMERLINIDEGWTSLMASPAMDMRDLGPDYVVLFSLPDSHESDITVTLEGRLLTVFSDSRRESGNRSGYSSFRRSVWLPGPVGDEQLARATLTNGLLRILVPKGDITANGVKRKLF